MCKEIIDITGVMDGWFVLFFFAVFLLGYTRADS